MIKRITEFLENSWIGKLVSQTIRTFDNGTEGFSLRKVAAAYLIIQLGNVINKQTVPTNLKDVILWVGLIVSVLIGLITIQQLYMFKTNSDTNNGNESTTTTRTSTGDTTTEVETVSKGTP